MAAGDLIDRHFHLRSGYCIQLVCNSFYFYIKPQPRPKCDAPCFVVIHSISTSNHNSIFAVVVLLCVVIHSISTSNHNGTVGDDNSVEL